MEPAEPLDAIWRLYRVTKDCLKVAQRAVVRADVRFLEGTDFVRESPSDTIRQIGQSRSDSDDFVILSLWAAFERVTLSFQRGRKLLEARPASLAGRLYAKYERDVEYWRAEDVLDVFKENIDGALLGNAKRIKKYRDWVAHRNLRKPPPEDVTPEFACGVLSEILTQVEAMEM